MPRAGVGRPFVAQPPRHAFALIPGSVPQLWRCAGCPCEMRVVPVPSDPRRTRREYRKTAQDKFTTSWPGYCAAALRETA